MIIELLIQTSELISVTDTVIQQTTELVNVVNTVIKPAEPIPHWSNIILENKKVFIPLFIAIVIIVICYINIIETCDEDYIEFRILHETNARYRWARKHGCLGRGHPAEVPPFPGDKGK